MELEEMTTLYQNLKMNHLILLRDAIILINQLDVLFTEIVYTHKVKECVCGNCYVDTKGHKRRHMSSFEHLKRTGGITTELCDCGSTCKKKYFASHKKTFNHLRYIWRTNPTHTIYFDFQ